MTGGADATPEGATVAGLACGLTGTGFAGGSSGIIARAPTPPATISRKASGAAISAERRKPSGPLPVTQPAAPGGGLWVLASTWSRRFGAGVAPTTA